MLSEPLRVLDDFAGTWSLERRVSHADGVQARLKGKARWTPEGARLCYHETGMLEIPGQAQVRAERRYIWAPDLTVYFEDGRVFHQIPAAGGSVTHFCAPDHYEGIYDFSQWPVFELSWVVTGPSKSYHMHSIYRFLHP